MKCYSCGKTVPGTFPYCDYCGARLHLVPSEPETAPSAPQRPPVPVIPRSRLQARRGTPNWAKLLLGLVFLGLIVGAAVQFWPSGLELQVPQQIMVGDKLTINLTGTSDPVMFVIRDPTGVFVAKRRVDHPKGYTEVVFDTNLWMPGNYYIEVRKYEAIRTKAERVGRNSFVITGVAEEPIYDAHFKVRIRQPLGGNFEVEKTVDIPEGPFQFRGTGASGWGTVAIITDLKVEAHGFILARTHEV